MDEVEAVLHFWFGELDARGCADSAHSARWWKKDEAFDAEIGRRFGALHAAIAGGEREAWRNSDRGCLAYVIALDQFSRNMFRGTARTFAYDDQALAASLAAIDRGVDGRLAFDERPFLYMPLIHSENLTAQERCIALFTALRDEAPGEAAGRAAGMVDYARRHRDIVARFGRFPHRNAALGRASTPEEAEFLKQPGSSF
jgi:uncharacterized protein (DUF924 family)